MRCNMDDSLQEIARLIKIKRKELGLTQADLSMRTGLGLRFIREVEQGKKATFRMDKVLQLLAYFGHKLSPTKIGAENRL